MAREVTDVEFNGSPSKKVKKNHKNKVHIKGIDLHPGGTSLTITKMESAMDSGLIVTWTVDGSTIDVHPEGKHIKFDSYLPAFAAAPQDKPQDKKPRGGDFGDITITLEYGGEPDLPAICEDVEHEP
jgi:hypothetical protein